MGEHTFEITDNNFQDEVLDSDTPVLIDFWAEWCGPCKMIAPIVDEIAGEYEGKLRVGKFDADQDQGLMRRYAIMSIPTLMLFKNGEPVERIQGFHKKGEIVNKIQVHID